MDQPLPKEWRYATSADDIDQLSRAGQLSAVCTCGHTKGNHREMVWDKHCHLCNCQCFQHAAYIIPANLQPNS